MRPLINATCGMLCLFALFLAGAPRALAWTLDSDVTFPSGTARGWAFGRSPNTENAIEWVNVTSKITEQGTPRDLDTLQCNREYNTNISPPIPRDIVCTQSSVDTTLSNNSNYCAPVSGIVNGNTTPATSNTCETWHVPPTAVANLERIGGGYCNWLITSILSNPDYTFIIERRGLLGGNWQQTYSGQDTCVARSGAYAYRVVYADIYGNRGPVSNTGSTNCSSDPIP